MVHTVSVVTMSVNDQMESFVPVMESVIVECVNVKKVAKRSQAFSPWETGRGKVAVVKMSPRNVSLPTSFALAGNMADSDGASGTALGVSGSALGVSGSALGNMFWKRRVQM